MAPLLPFLLSPLLLFVCFACFVVSSPASASPFYDYKIVAKSGDTIDGFPVQSLKRLVSINDNGHVAFIAEAAGGRQAVFVAEPGGSRPNKLVEATTGDYGSVSLNNENKVAVSYRVVAQGNVNAHIRRYRWGSTATGGASTFESVARATSARRSVTIDICSLLSGQAVSSDVYSAD